MLLELVYILCALTSMLCAILLIRAYIKQRSPLLLWSSICFFGLLLNNIMLYLDLVVFPETDFGLIRPSLMIASLACLLYGLIWECT